jgi:arylsulfatase
LPKWESLGPIQKKLYAREAENFAGYAAYTDIEIGRVIQAVEDMGKLDNTLIIYISGDNGTSAEGTVEGTFNQMTAYNGVLTLPEAVQMLHYEDWGSDKTYPHMSVAWSWAFDTPFKWTKQVASHFGGTGRAWSSPGPVTSRMWAAFAPSSITSSTSCRPSSKPQESKLPKSWTAFRKSPSKA